MSSIANLSSNPATRASLNIHPHGHKRGLQLDSAADSGSDSAAQIPAGTVKNLFSSLLKSLEEVIGVQSAATTPAPLAVSAAAGTTATGTTAAGTTAAGGNLSVHA